MVRRLTFLTAWIGLLFGCYDADVSSGLRRAPWEEFGFRAVRFEQGRSFDVNAAVPPLVGAETELRLLFELQPGNADYYYAGITRGRLALGKVECGVDVPLAEWRAPDGGPAFAAAGAERCA